MTIDNGSPPPEFLRLEPPQNGVFERLASLEPRADIFDWERIRDEFFPIIRQALSLAALSEATDDPLKNLAQLIRALTLEHITTMCSAMGKPDMRDTLVKWAAAYLDGTAMPEEKERRL